MNKVLWMLVFILIIPPSVPLSSFADPLFPSSVGRGSGIDAVNNSGTLLLAGRDYRDRYERRREIRRDIRRHYRKEQRKKQRRAAVAGVIIGGAVVGGIMAERERKRRAFEDAIRDHHHHHHHNNNHRFDYDY